MTALLEASATADTDLIAPLRVGPHGKQFTRLYDVGETRPGQALSLDLFDLAALLCSQFPDDADVIARLKGSALAPVLSKLNMRPAGLAALVQTARLHAPTSAAVADAVGPSRARTLREVWSDPEARKAPEAVLPRLAWRGRLTVYTALDKGGKSTLVAAGVAAMTRGQSFLGEPTVKGSCLWAMLEEHISDWAIRAKRFGTDEDAVHVLEHPSDPIAAIRAEAERLRPAVLVVDVLTRYAGERVTESGSAAQWTAVMVGLQEIARQLDVAVVVLHHARKSDGVARDSTEITARADVVLEQRSLPEDGVQRFTVRGRWTLNDFAVKLTGDRHELAGSGSAESTVSPQRRKIRDALKAGMTFTAWFEASGVPRSTFKDGVTWLTGHGLVELLEDGTYSPPRF